MQFTEGSRIWNKNIKMDKWKYKERICDFERKKKKKKTYFKIRVILLMKKN